MKRTILLILVAVLLQACGPSPPPVCDGKHQRALNPDRWTPPDDVAPAPAQSETFPSC